MNTNLNNKESTWKDELKLWTGIVFGFVALCVSIGSFILSRQSADVNLEHMEFRVVQELRNKFYGLPDHKKVPGKYWINDTLKAPEKNTEDWEKIKRYWQMSLEEWEVLNYEHKGMFAHRWKEDYVPRMEGVLEKRWCREVVVELLLTDRVWSVDIKYQEFGRELQRIYKEKFKKSLL